MTGGPDEPGERRRALLRYAAASALVAGAHVAGAVWLANHALSAEPDSVRGVPINLEMLAVAPPAPAQEAAAAAPLALPDPPALSPAAEPSPPPPAPEPPQASPEPSPPPEALAPPTEPTAEAPPPRPTPEPTKTPTPDAALAPTPPPPHPKPRPEPPKPRPKLPTPPKPDPEKAERERERAEARRQARQDAVNRAKGQTAVARAASAENRQGAAPQRASSGSDISTWRGLVLAHLSEFKPPSSGATGSAMVAFTIDAGGRVLSARLAGSSGDSALDAASVAMVRRASPVPAPPPDLGSRINLTVPVRFQ